MGYIIDVHRRTCLMKWPAGLIALATVALSAQTAPDTGTTFEVASVKAHVDPPGRTMFQFGAPWRVSDYRLSGTRVSLRETLAGLIVAAYHVRPYQISGDVTIPGPRGRDQIYEIDARTPGEKA